MVGRWNFLVPLQGTFVHFFWGRYTHNLTWNIYWGNPKKDFKNRKWVNCFLEQNKYGLQILTPDTSSKHLWSLGTNLNTIFFTSTKLFKLPVFSWRSWIFTISGASSWIRILFCCVPTCKWLSIKQNTPWRNQLLAPQLSTSTIFSEDLYGNNRNYPPLLQGTVLNVISFGCTSAVIMALPTKKMELTGKWSQVVQYE